MIFYVGDIHGRVDDVAAIDRAAIEAGVDIVVQVGDFGIRWTGDCSIAKYFDWRARQVRPGPTWYTCGGNHDNWDKWAELQKAQSDPGCAIDASKTVELAPGCFYVTRGTTIVLDDKKHLFCGGAESTDKHMRVEGVSWWENEAPSTKEFHKFFDSLEQDQPEIVVTHDAPLCVEIQRMNRDRNPTPRIFQAAVKLSEFMPAHWYFGHHHVLQDWDIEGTKFHCCGFHGEYKEGRNG